ncbi:MAG: adenylate/guanylate cyclase domain-containing protein [Elusimicrobiota bacterium]
MNAPVSRNLVILLTDIKGFTDRTSHQSRVEIQQLLERHKEIVLPILLGKGGTLIKTMGDAFLMTYESPTNAVLAGIEVQAALRRYNAGKAPEERIDLRVAINQGEVNLADNDVFGEAVNITARIEAIADAGDVFFTEGVYLAMNKKEVPSSEVGLLQLKGIPEKVRVYKVKSETPVKSMTDAASSGVRAHAEPSAPGAPRQAASPASAPAGSGREFAAFAGAVAVLGIGAFVILTRARHAGMTTPAATRSLAIHAANGSSTFGQTLDLSEGRQANFVGPFISIDGRSRRQAIFNATMTPAEGGRGELDVEYQLDLSGDPAGGVPPLKIQGKVAMRAGGSLVVIDCDRWTVDFSLGGSGAGQTDEAAELDNYRATAELSKGREKIRCGEVVKLGAQGNVQEGAGKKPRVVFNSIVSPSTNKENVDVEFQLEYRPSENSDLLQVQNHETLVLGRANRSQISGYQFDLLAEAAASPALLPKK